MTSIGPAVDTLVKRMNKGGRSVGVPVANGKERRMWMFRFGTVSGELEACLRKLRAQLITAGVRADNLPNSEDARCAFAAALPEKALAHVRSWFRANANFDDLPASAEACRQLVQVAVLNDVDSPEHRRLWRAVLAGFACGIDTAEVSLFLSGVVSGLSEPAQPEVQAPDVPPAPDDERLSASVKALASQLLPPSDGVIWPASIEELGIDDFDSFTVLAQRTKQLPSGQFFIHIGGIFVDGMLAGLSRELASEVFPFSGDATGYLNVLHMSEDEAGSLAVWRVEHRNSVKSAHYGVSAFVSQTYEVFNVPHGSETPDLVRDWIKEVYLPAPHLFPIFRLLDGVFIKPPTDTCDPGASNFDTPLNGYQKMRCVRWHDRQIVVGPLPASDLKFDCSPPRTIVKRLLKSALELSSLPTLTKAQIADLAENAARNYADSMAPMALRAQRHLEALFDTREMVDDAMEDILKLPVVRDAIEREMQRAANGAAELNGAARAELAKLAAEKKQLLAEFDRAKQAQKKETAALAREIKLAFEHAGSEGIKSLASIALFKNVLGFNAEWAPPSRVAPGLPALPTQPEPDLVEAVPALLGIASSKELQAVFAKWYLYSGLSTSLMCTALAAAAAVGVLVISGSRSEETASALAHTLCGGADCCISISSDMFSLSDLMKAPAAVRGQNGARAAALGDVIEQRQRVGEVLVVRLAGANRMPPESYIPELLAACRRVGVLPWTDRRGMARVAILEHPVVFLLDAAQGRSVFPFAAPIAWEIPLVDTDAPWPDYGDPIGGGMPTATATTPDFLRSLAAAAGTVGWLAPSSMPWNGRRSAEAMVRACRALGMGTNDAAAAVLLSLARGRVVPAVAAEYAGGGSGALALAFGPFAAFDLQDNIFDMDNRQ